MPPLDDAYFAAIYTVDTSPPRRLTFTRSVSPRPNPPLPFTQPWAIITAFNPRSHQLSDQENAARDRNLRAQLQTHPITRTTATDPRGQFPEQGWLIERITRNDILTLARAFDQRAIVFTTSNKTGLLYPTTERWLVRPLDVL